MYKNNTVGKHIYGYMLAILSSLVSLPSVANEAEEQLQSFSPTLVQLQQAAIARNPQLAVQAAEKQMAQADLRLAQQQWLPSVSANLSKSYGRGSGSFLDTNVANRRVNESGKIGFNITQRLYDPATNINIEQAKLTAQSTDFAIEQTYDELTNRIVSLFLDILATQAEITLLQGQQIAVEDQKKQAQLSFDVGTVSITDVREAEAKYDRIAAQLAALNWQMQAKQAEIFTLTGYRINPDDYQSSTKILPDVAKSDLQRWLVAIDYHNSQLAQANIDYQVASLEVDKLRYKYYPTVQLVVENNRYLQPWTSQGRERFSNNKWDWSAGVEVHFNLFDGSTSQAQSTKVLSSQVQRFETIRDLQERLNIELQQTFYQILASIAEYQGLYKADQSAKTALLANMLGYQVGMRINADVLDAQAKIYEVNRDRLISWSDSWRNYIKLNQIAGTLTIEQLAQIDNILRQDVANHIPPLPEQLPELEITNE